MIFVLNTRLRKCCGARKRKKAVRNEKTRCQRRFFQSGTQTLNSCLSLHYELSNKSIIFFNDLCKPIEIYIFVRKKHPVTCCPAAKHPKQNKLAVTDIREKPVDFFKDTARASRNNFAKLGSFAKVSVPFKICNSLVLRAII